MLAAIRHGLGNLTNIGGRDARQAFWYYVLFIYVITVAVAMVVVVPLTLQAFFTGIRQGVAAGQSGDPAAAQAATQAAIAASMGDMMTMMMWMSVGTGILMLLALAAAFVRRLHDSGMSGWWALAPALLHTANIALAPSQLSRMQELMQASVADPAAGMAIMGSFGAAAVLGWSALVLVIVLGVRKSTPGANRYGDAPFIA